VWGDFAEQRGDFPLRERVSRSIVATRPAVLGRTRRRVAHVAGAPALNGSVGTMSNAVVASLTSPNFSSAALSRVLARLSAEWQARDGHPILVVETLVDPERFQGTVDRARLDRTGPEQRQRT